MYPLRIVRCPSHAGQRAARCGPGSSRALSSFFPGPYWRHSRGIPYSVEALTENNPWARAIDEQMTRAFDSLFPTARQSEGEASQQPQRRSFRAFEPRFDARETETAYELRGELPGVAASDIHVEFPDPNTLVVSGKTESEVTHGTPPTATTTEQAVQANADQTTAAAADNTDAASVHSHESTSSYVKPSLEDEAEASSSQDAAATPATEAPATETAPATTEAKEPEQPQEKQSTYWMSERTTGSFQRTFRFPGRVDLDAVTASLKNGVLDIVVPKKAVESKRIAVN